MNSSHLFSRRQILRHASLVTAGALLPGMQRAIAAPAVPDALAGRHLQDAQDRDDQKQQLVSCEKFKIAKEAGFMGVEMGFPGE
jgi:hypothetical protein